MNNEKIGKFIRKLRKAKGLTQQQLGDLVNVGGKSVSKWERGINMPDISIINEVSKILDITSDELLKGEFDRNSTNKEYIKKKKQKRVLILLVLLIILTTIITTLSVFYFKNDVHKYWITGNTDTFDVHGTIEYDKKEYKINIDKVYCKLEECKSKYIGSIKYSLSIDGTIIYMNSNTYDKNKSITVNEYLSSKKIIITNGYNDGNVMYDNIKDGINNMSILIEVSVENELYEYAINLKITDKKR